MRKKVFIAEHISTGGMPQYLLHKVGESIENEYDVWVLIYSDIAPIYNVQRKKLSSLIGNKLIVFNKEVEEIIKTINNINPSILHVQEIPELWMPKNLADELYKKDRTYEIWETSHISTFDVKNKVYFPDKFVFVTHLHEIQYKHLNIPYTIEEYPIFDYNRPDRETSLRELNLDPSYIHVLNVGLFTPGKNQKQIFDIARLLLHEKILFHFVGNLAINFSSYWKPLLEDKPHNCIIWGERDDVDKFYSSMDIFLFTSVWECNPIVVREAISWKMPIYMNNLDYYVGCFNDFQNVTFIDKMSNTDIAEMIMYHGTVILNKGQIISRMYNDNNITRIFFHIPQKSDKNTVFIIDKNTNLLVYKKVYENMCDGDYQLLFSDEYKTVGSCVFQILSENGDIIHDNTLHVNKNHGTIIENVDFHTLPGDIKWNKYCDIFIAKRYENDFLRIDTNDIVVDIGANYGLFSLYAVQCGASKIYAIEPSPVIRSYIEHNTAKYENIVVITDAISSHDGKTTVYGNDITPIEINTKTINTIMKEHNISSIDVLHLNCSGDEYSIIDSIDDDLLRNNIKKIIIEIHDIDDNREQIINMIRKLDDNGFYVLYGNDEETMFAINSCSNYMDKIMGDTVDTDITIENKHYSDVDIEVDCKYILRPRVDIKYGPEPNYKVVFGFTDSNHISYSTIIPSNGGWAQSNIQYLQPWKIQIINSRNEIVWRDIFDPTGKHVYISFDSKAMGDNLAWIPAVDTFQKKYNATVTVSTFWNILFESEYPNLTFVSPGSAVKDVYAMFNIGCFDNDSNRNKNNWRQVPLQQVATDILGLDFEEIVPRVKKSTIPRKIKSRYVCISDQSTMQCKMWNYPNGWNIVIDYLNTLGYEVVLLGSTSSNLVRVINKNGCSIEDTIHYLQHAEMFIGLGSGLSWLSWAVGTPVIMISGFSKEWTEFSDCHRVINKSVCHGCYNDVEFPYDRNWDWCPRKKDFECTKSITPDMVIREIDSIVGVLKKQ